ncbi:hypothetical protein J1N35_019391 [Gossypium stocksii]|uniref:Reverse transcriptase domain-containing protein n=1 Tax=Gossypium stocksii TaxID=47602 RepID=A0A9D3VR86_9ROSI|nr:hypothetical protein J1N35_019391 [Gossypium stocksii]
MEEVCGSIFNMSPLKAPMMDGFHAKFYQANWECVSSSSMQLFWNDSLSEGFIPSRGVRQGNPLSPYLFILVMERLGHLIEAAIE